MKHDMKKVTAALLAALMLAASGCSATKNSDTKNSAEVGIESTAAAGIGSDTAAEPASAEPETEPAEETLPLATPEEEAALWTLDTASGFEDELVAEALALTLAGWDAGYLDDANGVWGVIGWYAALLNRVNDGSGAWISEWNAARLERMLRPEEDALAIPDEWFGEGGSAVRTTVNTPSAAVPGYSFPGYDELLQNTLGIWREISAERADGVDSYGYRVTITDHYDDGTTGGYVSEIAFLKQNDDTWGLASFYMTEIGGGANFTVEMVDEANRITHLLDLYGSVQVTSVLTEFTSSSIFTKKDGRILESHTSTFFEEDDEAYSFTSGYAWSEDGQAISSVIFEGNVLADTTYGNLYADLDEDEYEIPEGYPNDGFLLGYIPEGDLTLTSDDGDTYSFHVENDEGYYCDCTVEAGSLAILSYTGGDRNDPESIYSFTTTLGGELPPIPAFDAWESTREVTLHVETAEGEDTVVYTVPGDWEFMVYFADDFTLYDSETQTEPLYENIPGDGQNHELWASNAVG